MIMKKTSVAILLSVLTLLSIWGIQSCERYRSGGENSKGQQAAVGKQLPTIGYEKQNGSFVEISESDLVEFYKFLGLVTSEANISSIEVKDFVDDSTQNTYYIVYCSGTDGTLHVKISGLLEAFNGDPNTLKLVGKTCTCKSVNCTEAWGCDASLTYSGACSCSPCTGEGATCEKTSTVTSSLAMSQFFEGI